MRVPGSLLRSAPLAILLVLGFAFRPALADTPFWTYFSSGDPSVGNSTIGFSEGNGSLVLSQHDIWIVGAANMSGDFQAFAEHCDPSSTAGCTTAPPYNAAAPPAASSSQLNGVYGTGTGDVWAVGYSAVTNVFTEVQQPLVEHWNGAGTGEGWTIIPQPSALATNADCASPNELNAVWEDSTGTMWAAGSFRNQSCDTVPLIEQCAPAIANTPPYICTFSDSFDGLNTSPLTGVLNGISGTSPSDIWAVGQTEDSPAQTLILHYNGTSWSQVASPNNTGSGAAAETNVLNAVVSAPGSTAVGAAGIHGSSNVPAALGDVWAVGYWNDSVQGAGHDHTLIERYDPNASTPSWSIVSSVDASPSHNDRLNGVTAVNGNDIWAVGADYADGFVSWQAMAEHWDGTSWTLDPSLPPSPNPANNPNTTLLGVSAAVDGTEDLWAVGNSSGVTNSPGDPPFVIYHSSGATAARIGAVSASRHHASVTVRWSAPSRAGIAGFNVYVGIRRLNAHLIPLQAGAVYSFTTRIHAHGHYAVGVVFTSGGESRIVAGGGRARE